MKAMRIRDLCDYDPEKRVRKALVKSDGLAIEMVCYEPGQHTVTHYHPRQDEVFIVLEGRGTITVDGVEIPVEPTSVVFVQANEKHAVVTASDSRMVMLFAKGPGRRFFDTPLNETPVKEGETD